MLVDFLNNDDFYIKIDIVETDKMIIKYLIQIKHLFNDSEVLYSDNLWFEEKTIEDLINNISFDKKIELFNIDRNFSISLDENFLIISIIKNKAYNTDKTIINFKVDISSNITKFKEELSKLKYC